MKNNFFLLRELNSQSLAPKVEIIPLDQIFITYFKILDFNNKYTHTQVDSEWSQPTHRVGRSHGSHWAWILDFEMDQVRSATCAGYTKPEPNPPKPVNKLDRVIRPICTSSHN